VGHRSTNRRSISLSSDGAVVDGDRIPLIDGAFLGVVPDTEPGWMAQAQTLRIGETTFARAVAPPGQLSVRAWDEPQYAAICHVLEGELSLQFNGCGPSTHRYRGQAWYWQASASFAATVIERVVLSVALVARNILDDAGVDISPPYGPVHTPTILTLAAARFIEGVIDAESDPDPLTAYSIEKLMHKLASAMLPSSQGLPAHAAPPITDMFSRAMTLMTAQRANPSVTPTTIAADLHVSLRQLQREFSRRNSTVAGTLRELRTDLAVNLLRNPKYDVLTIDQIASYAGFSGAQQMRRTLAAAGYPAPFDLRNFRPTASTRNNAQP
jgi:AraC-like DNA-binding protein